ncbi:RNA-binding protein [Halorhabdus rudnickae]|uniref:RNA-binding protein n=1 Tax=Halorhabdus rudnickae TaxID=1775544 RepID=UPI0010827BD0|nr:RNA-binding protein [Halorhabdus rudnickae]
MASVPFHYVDLRTFCYATEDEARVEDALRTFLPEDAPVERVETEGHHGDRILVLSTRLERADEVRHVLSKVASLEADERERLLGELDERVDENCSFFLTLSKQAAFEGRVERGDGITLRGKVEAYPAEKDRAIEHVRETLEEL